MISRFPTEPLAGIERMTHLLKNFALLLSLGLLTLTLTACQPTDQRSKNPGQRRIVVESPSITEILFQIGAGEEVVGVSKYTSYPPEATTRTKISVMPVNLEIIHDLQPTLILVSSQAPKLNEFARTENIPIETIRIETLKDLYQSIEQIGKLTGREAPAKKEVERIQSSIAQLKSNPKLRGKSAFISIARAPGQVKKLMTSSRSFLIEAVESTGLTNAFPKLKARYPQMTLEAIIDRDPDFIIELQGKKCTDSEKQRLIDDWNSLGKLSAVKNKRVIVISGSEVLLPGPRVTETFAKVHKALSQ